jgi:hypothetical protein
MTPPIDVIPGIQWTREGGRSDVQLSEFDPARGRQDSCEQETN